MSSSKFISKVGKSFVSQAKKMIVIAGGVGPAAGVSTHEQIVKMTNNGLDKDQGHASTVQVSFSGSVKDRTVYLLENDKNKKREMKNPGIEMSKAINRTLSGHMAYPGNMVLGVPCNTFHAPEIWNEFIDNLENRDRIMIINMIEETAKKIKIREEVYAKKIVVGLLSTKGTRDTGVYSTVMKESGIELLTLDNDQQEKVTQAIYDERTGIKGQAPDWEDALKLINGAIESLRKRGAEVFILGCTELPLPYQILQSVIPTDCLDPAAILAERLVEESGHIVKKEHKKETPNASHGNDYLNLEDDDGFMPQLETQDMSKMEEVE